MGISNSIGESWLSNGFFEYLLVAHPDGLIGDRVIKEKNWFAGHYKVAAAAKAAPHITVANFLAREAMEPTMAKWMQQAIGMLHSFTVTLENYGGFRPHTIYLQVTDTAPFQQLTRQLKPIADFIRNSSCPAVRFISMPHVTIARKLPENIYHTAATDYAQKTFQGSFMLEDLVLLRRQHAFDSCKTIQVFRLKPPDTNRYSDVA